MRLRAPQAADVAILVEIFSHPDVARWWPHETAATVEALILGDEPHLTGWVIEVDGNVAGWIQAYEEPDPDYRHAAIDLAVRADVHGRGVGPAAIRRLAEHLFSARGHHRLTIDPNAANHAAIRAYEKVGFRPVGVMQQYEFDHAQQRWTDGLLMELLVDDLAAG
jgi:aminoglycoside 6'-N-acetyltransferase